MATNSATNIVLYDNSKEFALITTWGCDGSTGHSEYKQRALEGASNSDIFITPVIPLRLYATKTSRDKIILWQNPRPSSVRSCRPVRIQLKQQAAELAKEETSVVEERIKKL
jgi:hypothetical protein